MSIQAVAWVLDQSQSRGFARLVLIALANHHNQGTAQCNPGQRLIAKEAGISAGSVGANVAKLVALGELEVVEDGGSHRSAQYRLPFMDREVRAAAERTDDGLPASTREVRAAAEQSTRGIPASTRGPEPRRTIEPIQEPEPERASALVLLAQPPPPAKKRASLIPDGWEPSEATKQWTRDEYPEYAKRGVLEHFRDHHVAKGSRFVDWDAAFKTWVRRQPEFARSNGNANREPTRTYLGNGVR